MKLFTFLVEFEGGTYCSQHLGINMGEAVSRFLEYAKTSEYLQGLPGDDVFDDISSAVELDGLENAFNGSTVGSDDNYYHISIVETVSKSAVGDRS